MLCFSDKEKVTSLILHSLEQIIFYRNREGLAHAQSPGTGIKRMRIKLGIGTFAPLLLAHAHKPEKSTLRACAFTQIQIYFCLKLLICYLFNLN